jgi:hypothetical protein
MKILLRNKTSHKWETIESASYAAENELQRLLAETPSLISIDEIIENASPLVIGVREIGLPGSGSTDILAFSTAGDIVIVECKLAANIEIKRKVIAQVLEYGSYLWNMPYDDLNNLIFKKTSKNLADLLSEAIGDTGWNEEEFRSNIQANLNNGTFILIIAVDELNDELVHTIRFLNTCGNPTFTFTALEVKRFQKDDAEILVPHLFGISGQQKPGGRKQWTEKRFFDVVRATLSPDIVSVIENLFTWSQRKANRVWFGTGTATGSFTFHYLLNGKTNSIFSVFTTGVLILNFGWLTHLESDTTEWFHRSIRAIPGFESIPNDVTGWPSLRIKDILNQGMENFERFKVVIEEMGQRIR